MGLARCRLGNEGQGCEVVDGMIVPQPRDKTWGRTELGREVLVLYWSGQVESQGVGRDTTALPPGGRVKSVISQGGSGGREEGLA